MVTSAAHKSTLLQVLEPDYTKENKLQQRQRGFCSINKWLSLLVCVLVSLRLLSGVRTNNGVGVAFHVSCEESQSLVRVHHNFIPSRLFQRFNKELPDHPLITRNHLDNDGFHNTWGFLVKFNLEGMEILRSKPDFKLIVPYLDSVRLADTNAYVLNMLIANQTHPQQLAVKGHFDNSVAIRRREGWVDDIFMAHQVNVLYTNIPAGIQGGQLQVWPMGSGGVAPGKAEIMPAENMMVAFRGDAAHSVKGFASPSGSPRISLVFEQYKIGAKYYSRTYPYCENSECNRSQDDSQALEQ